MKKRSFKFCLLIILLQAFNILSSQEPPPDSNELWFTNSTSDTIRVQVYPIGLIMNGRSQYSLIARFPLNILNRQFNYNNGVRIEFGTKKT